MGRGQRLTFLAIAAAIAVVAVIVLAGSGGDEEPAETAATATPAATETAAPQEAEPQETATPAPTPEPTPEPPPLLRSGRVTELEFTEGERIRFRVRSANDEEIHVHGYNVTRDIPAGETVNVSFPADITGIFEIEFHGSGEPIAELKVEPD